MKAKKILLAFGAFILSVPAFSQTDTTSRGINQKKDSPANLNTPSVSTQQQGSTNNTQNTTSNNTTSVDAASSTTQINVPKPNHGRYYIPVLGTYQPDQASATADAKPVTITPDENNPGKIWVEGLADTKFYAVLKAIPGTYKIPTQDQGDKPVSEGEIRYDENNKSISICLGCGYHDNASTEVTPPVATSTAKTSKQDKSAKKPKSIIINFTGVKSDNGSVSLR